MHMNNYQAIITSMHFCETVLKFIVAIATYLCWYLIFIERYSTLPECTALVGCCYCDEYSTDFILLMCMQHTYPYFLGE